MDEQLAIIALQRLKGIDLAIKRRLFEGEENLGSLFEGKASLHDEGVYKIITAFKGWNNVDRYLKAIREMGVDVLTIRD